MPFDAAPNPKELTTLDLLLRAYDRVESGRWIKRAAVRKGGNGKTYFCLQSAVLCEDDGSLTEHFDSAMKAEELVYKSLPLRVRETGIPAWNDHYTTRKADVLRVLRKAISEAMLINVEEIVCIE